MRRFIPSFLLFLLSLTGYGQDSHLVELHHYDETNSNLAGHTTQLLQDRNGFLWIATWNGICRFDGYEFRRLKPQPGDGCTMASDRIRDIWLADNGVDIYCRSDDAIYRFDAGTYRFCNIESEDELHEAEGCRNKQFTRGTRHDEIVDYDDPQGLRWQLREDVLYCYTHVETPAQPLPMEQPDLVRCIFMDSQQRIWLATREDATVRLLDSKGSLLGYLGSDGRISRNYCSFGQAVYCITEASDGSLWVGTKPGGLYRLTRQSEGMYKVDAVNGLENPNVYSVAQDHHGRLWVATLGGGIACIEQPSAAQPVVHNRLKGFPEDVCQKVRYIHITPDDILLATTTEGLIVGSVSDANIENIRFHRHIKEPLRPQSLSCNATMDIVASPEGRLFVSTETGGVCQILSSQLLSDTLDFRHYNTQNGLLPTDMTVGMVYANGGKLLVVGNTQLIILDLLHDTYECLDHHFFHHLYWFSETRPLLLRDGRWLVGTREGAFFLPQSLAHRSNYQPPLLLTSITVQKRGEGSVEHLAVHQLDTLRLAPSERSVTIHFAALDFTDPSAINYQFRLGADTVAWTHIGHNRSITLPMLEPDTYTLAIRSTNADGQWTNNTRLLTIIVEPTFWETPWALLLILFVALIVVAAVVFTILYIRRIKRHQQQTLEAYLKLVAEYSEEEQSPQEPSAVARQPESLDGDPFMQRVLTFVEQHLGDSNADIGQMAEACAVSRSVLQRRMKQLMGVSPGDFLREARIKHAAQLLQQSGAHVSDVAYRCGFSDPKYFSRCFKQSLGVSPSEFKAKF